MLGHTFQPYLEAKIVFVIAICDTILLSTGANMEMMTFAPEFSGRGGGGQIGSIGRQIAKKSQLGTHLVRRNMQKGICYLYYLYRLTLDAQLHCKYKELTLRIMCLVTYLSTYNIPTPNPITPLPSQCLDVNTLALALALTLTLILTCP